MPFIKKTHTFEGLKYNLDNKDRVAASAATQGVDTGVVTQATSHATGVTLNKRAGVITLAADAVAATTNVEFTFTNDTIKADSVILLTMQDENTTNNKQLACAVHTIAAGSCVITIVNPHSASSTSATASKIHFLIINSTA